MPDPGNSLPVTRRSEALPPLTMNDVFFDEWQITAQDIKANKETNFNVQHRYRNAEDAQKGFEVTHGKLYRVTKVVPLRRDGMPVTPDNLNTEDKPAKSSK